METATIDPVQSRNPDAEPELVLIKTSLIQGTGAFARRDIPKGTRVIEYIGEKISKQESLRRCEADNEYIFTLNGEQDLDGKVDWNPARFINHSCTPNCDADVENDHIWIVAARDLKEGEELTYNYGFDLEDYKDYPCRCGSPECVGFIVSDEFFEHVRKQQEIAREAALNIEPEATAKNP
jgi:SET domain-containing protein